jgi:hypothetical protein
VQRVEEDKELVGRRRHSAGRCVDEAHNSFERIRDHVGLFLHMHDEGRESALQLGCEGHKIKMVSEYKPNNMQ